MKEIRYIEFDSGWRPPAYRRICILQKRFLYTQQSKNGDFYSVYLGYISDMDATYLVLSEPAANIRDVKDSRFIERRD